MTVTGVMNVTVSVQCMAFSTSASGLPFCYGSAFVFAVYIPAVFVCLLIYGTKHARGFFRFPCRHITRITLDNKSTCFQRRWVEREKRLLLSP